MLVFTENVPSVIVIVIKFFITNQVKMFILQK